MAITKNEAKMARKGGAPENLRPCTPENARERQLKSAQKRSENASVKKIIEQNLEAIIDLVNTPMTEEEFQRKVRSLPNQFQRIYAADLRDSMKARLVVEKLVDRYKGLPSPEKPIQVEGNVEIKLKFGDE